MFKFHRFALVWFGLYVGFTLGRWDIYLSRALLAPWEFRKRRTDNGVNLVWWVFSLDVADWTVECYGTCACCNSPDIGERHAGDEGWTVCGECGAVEQGYLYLNKHAYEELGY